jgi:hypothetical protein
MLQNLLRFTLAFSIKGIGLPGSRSADQDSSAGHFLSGNYAEKKYVSQKKSVS